MKATRTATPAPARDGDVIVPAHVVAELRYHLRDTPRTYWEGHLVHWLEVALGTPSPAEPVGTMTAPIPAEWAGEAEQIRHMAWVASNPVGGKDEGPPSGTLALAYQLIENLAGLVQSMAEARTTSAADYTPRPTEVPPPSFKAAEPEGAQ